jgi:peroxiredoxin
MEFQRKYKSSGLSAIGVSLDEDGWKSVKPFLKRKPINYPIVVGDDGLAKLYGVEQMPVTLLIDRDGKIADVHTGMVDKDAFEGEIQRCSETAPKVLQDEERAMIGMGYCGHGMVACIVFAR